MNRCGGSSSLLSVLLVLLIALGPWPLLAGYPSSDGCYTTTGSAAETHSCCDVSPDCSQSVSSCSATNCSTPFFLLSPGVPSQFSLPLTDASFVRRSYASHLSAPSIPPPIVRSLS